MILSPLGENTHETSPPGDIVECVSCCRPEPSAFITSMSHCRALPLGLSNTIRWPSGENDGCWPVVPLVSALRAEPSAFITSI